MLSRRMTSFYVWGIFAVGMEILSYYAITEANFLWSAGGAFWLVMAAGVVGVALAGSFPVRISLDTKISLDGSIVMAALLLLPPGAAFLVIALGVSLANLYLRRPANATAFNIGQYLLAAAAASAFLPRFQFGMAVGSSEMLGLIVGAFVFMTVNIGALAGVLAVSSRLPFFNQMRSLWKSSGVHYTVLMAVGALMAIVYTVMPVAVLFVLLPLYLVHQSYSDQAAQERNTRETIISLANVIDDRDPYTAAHSRRVANYARDIARAMSLPAEQRDKIELAASVHDIGKIGTSAEILLKPGQLTDAEWAEMQKHPRIGADLIARLTWDDDTLDMVLYHHRTFDGGGYPQVPTDDFVLPLGSRIISVADAYDAMTTDRPYRRGLAMETAIAELQRGAGRQFDPQVVNAFVNDVLRPEPEKVGSFVVQHEFS